MNVIAPPHPTLPPPHITDMHIVLRVSRDVRGFSGAKVVELRSFECKARGPVPLMESGISPVTSVVEFLGR